MVELKNEKIAIPLVLFAGILWSFGPLVVRYMDSPDLVPWQYIFGRGLTIFIILNLYLYFEEGINFYKNYKKVGRSGLIGGSGLGIAMITFIYSITNTSDYQFHLEEQRPLEDLQFEMLLKALCNHRQFH